MGRMVYTLSHCHCNENWLKNVYSLDSTKLLFAKSSQLPALIETDKHHLQEAKISLKQERRRTAKQLQSYCQVGLFFGLLGPGNFRPWREKTCLWGLRTGHAETSCPATLTHYLIETPFNAFANRADPDQAALIRAALSWSTLLLKYDITYTIGPDRWQVISLFYVPTWKFIYIIIHSRWSLALIFMKERVNWLESWNFVCDKFSYHTFHWANIIDTDQTVWMHRTVFAVDVCMQQNQVLSWLGPFRKSYSWKCIMWANSVYSRTSIAWTGLGQK